MHEWKRAAVAAPLICAAALAAALVAPPVAAEQGDAEEASSRLFSTMLLGSSQFEVGETIRVEISVANRAAEWAEIADGAELASRVALRTPSGRTVAPEKPGRVGAARTTSLGPGGFIGITFDARELFPVLKEPGRYALLFAPDGAAERTIEFDVLPAFDPSKDYWLELTSSSGTIGIDLDEKAAPAGVRSLARLAWQGRLDGATVPRLQPGFAMQIAPSRRAAATAIPFEQTSRQLLAGTVILEPTLRGGERVNTSSLVVLLAPQTAEPGSATAVGHVAKGRDVLETIAGAATTGADGSPPWQPREPIVFDTVSVVVR